MTDWAEVCVQILQAEAEAEVQRVLAGASLLSDGNWVPLGDIENNFAIVGAQHSDPTGALVEKLVNGIDAVLMAACYTSGIEPESPAAPQTVAAAVEQFFSVQGGRLGTLGKQVGTLANHVQLIATGNKDAPPIS